MGKSPMSCRRFLPCYSLGRWGGKGGIATLLGALGGWKSPMSCRHFLSCHSLCSQYLGHSTQSSQTFPNLAYTQSSRTLPTCPTGADLQCICLQNPTTPSPSITHDFALILQHGVVQQSHQLGLGLLLNLCLVHSHHSSCGRCQG